MLGVAYSNAHAACEDDTLQSVSDDGAILIMISGEVFHVNPTDQVDTALWLSTDGIRAQMGPTRAKAALIKKF
jgi:hypothetical protein